MQPILNHKENDLKLMYLDICTAITVQAKSWERKAKTSFLRAHRDVNCHSHHNPFPKFIPPNQSGSFSAECHPGLPWWWHAWFAKVVFSVALNRVISPLCYFVLFPIKSTMRNILGDKAFTLQLQCSLLQHR